MMPNSQVASMALILIALSLSAWAGPQPQAVSFAQDHQAKASNDETFNNPGFISNPSIYTYSVSQQKTRGSNDKLNEDYSSNNNNQNDDDNIDDNQSDNFIDETSFIKFASSSNPNSNLNDKIPMMKPKRKSPVNRNFYNTEMEETKQSDIYATAMDATPTQPAPATGCTVDRLAIYKVVLHTYWTRDLFPKHYPDWRPTAQWTKTIGRTHNSAYALYHLGQPATPGVKQFAETGKSDILDSFNGEQQQLQQQQQQQDPIVTYRNANPYKSTGSKAMKNERSVFDEFNLASVSSGAGRSESKFFVDSNHSLVSLMTRIVPSPDWFIGVDSFELCVGGSWIDTVTVELDPLDAGTDNGFTFTAPNWPTSPQGVIYRITSRYPAHPAGSFFYPKNKRLPPIATFQFIKLKEYELSEVFNFAEDDRKYETVKTQTHLETEHNHVEMNNELSASIERERQNEISPQPTAITEHDRIRSKLLANLNPMNNSDQVNMTRLAKDSQTFGSLSVVPKNNKHALIQNIVQSYQRTGNAAAPSWTAKRRRGGKRQRDCRVSHWSDWTPCNKSCGIGEMHRYRKVIKHGKRGGRPCPPLQESKWCGSDKPCYFPDTSAAASASSSYFNWSDT